LRACFGFDHVDTVEQIEQKTPVILIERKNHL